MSTVLEDKALRKRVKSHTIDNSDQPFSNVQTRKKSTIIKEGQKTRSKKEVHYVDNAAFFLAMEEYIIKCKKHDLEGLKRPKIPDFIGECFLKVATKFANHPSFVRYTYKDEMIDRAVEACIRYLHNFNPAKSHNPFSYFTQTCYYSFMNTLEIEEEEMYVKCKSIMNAISLNLVANFDGDEDAIGMMVANTDIDLSYVEEYVEKFERKMQRKKERQSARNIKTETPTDTFFE